MADNEGGYVPSDGPIEGRVYRGEYVLTADQKRRAIESAKALRQRLLDRLRDDDA